MEQLPHAIDVDAGICEETLCRATLNDGSQQIAVAEVLATLGHEQHRGVAFPPGLEGLGDVGLDGRIADEAPRFVDDAKRQPALTGVRTDCGTGPMKHIKEK